MRTFFWRSTFDKCAEVRLADFSAHHPVAWDLFSGQSVQPMLTLGDFPLNVVLYSFSSRVRSRWKFSSFVEIWVSSFNSFIKYEFRVSLRRIYSGKYKNELGGIIYNILRRVFGGKFPLVAISLAAAPLTCSRNAAECTAKLFGDHPARERELFFMVFKSES